jgi:hypothetical protein
MYGITIVVIVMIVVAVVVVVVAMRSLLGEMSCVGE